MSIQRRRWHPLERAVRVEPSPEKIAAMKAEVSALGKDPDDVERMLAEPAEVWKNDRYTVHVKRGPEGYVGHLSIRRNDRAPEPFPWRELQRIKTQLAGAEVEAVELFPAESRLVDTANQRWLWCLRPGERVPVGFDEGRLVSGPEAASRMGARQAPLEEGY